VVGEKGVKKLLILLGMLTTCVHASTEFENCHYGKEELPAMICYGPADLKGTVIKGGSKVVGSLTATDISVGEMTIAGDAEIKKATINGDIEVIGDLHASETNFKKNITVFSSTAFLNHSKVYGEIKIQSDKVKPYLEIQCGTIVAGDVAFTSLPGIVQIAGDSVVQGKIINGAIEFIDRDCSE
jgi:hypothetical protein